ncbi:MAG: hypothetical protein ACREIR_16775 [Geminicoccaceae bacterium]
MAFPWLFEEGFEGGNKGAFNSESDSGARLDFPGPMQLAEDGFGIVPHRGAYCMRVDLAKNATDAYVQEDDGFDIAADGTLYTRFQFCLSPDFAIGNDLDEFDIFGLFSAGADETYVSVARADPDGAVLALRQNEFWGNYPYIKIPVGEWITVELKAHVDDGASNDGNSALWVNGHKLIIEKLDQGVVTHARLGVMNQSGNFKGHIYFDSVFADDARLYPMEGPPDMSPNLDGETMVMTQSGWAFFALGMVTQLQLIDGGSGDCKAKLFDTDELTRSQHQLRDQLNTTAANQITYSEHHGVEFLRGCYVELSGTSPMALVRIGMPPTLVEMDQDTIVPPVEAAPAVEG